MDYLSWFVWEFLYTLFWRSPICYVTWFACIVLAVGSRTEFVKHGAGFRGGAFALWFAIKNFPRTVNEILRWATMQIVLLAGLVTRTDVFGILPIFVRRWLGHGPFETKTIYRDRIVDRVKWKRPPIKWRIARTVSTVLFGMALLRAYDYGYLGPWAYTAVTWIRTLAVWVYNQMF